MVLRATVELPHAFPGSRRRSEGRMMVWYDEDSSFSSSRRSMNECYLSTFVKSSQKSATDLEMKLLSRYETGLGFLIQFSFPSESRSYEQSNTLKMSFKPANCLLPKGLPIKLHQKVELGENGLRHCTVTITLPVDANGDDALCTLLDAVIRAVQDSKPEILIVEDVGRLSGRTSYTPQRLLQTTAFKLAKAELVNVRKIVFEASQRDDFDSYQAYVMSGIKKKCQKV